MLVERHAIRAAFAKQFTILQRAVGLNGVAVYFFVADIGNVECRVVRRTDESVRALETVCHADHFSPGRDIVHMFPVLRVLSVSVVGV